MNGFDDADFFTRADLPVIQSQSYDPYECNGGTIMAIAGEDFATIAGDTRLMNEDVLCSRNQNKLFQLMPLTVMGSVGCWADALAVVNVVKQNIHMYQINNSKRMSTDAFAQMLSIVLYSHRFFPYFVSNIVAGIDRNGKGAVFSYDPVGHHQRKAYEAAGTGYKLILPAMDYLIKNLKEPITIKDAMDITANVMKIADDRDIYTGDSTIMYIITKDGVEAKEMAMRKD
ncbi:proteasome subunit beta type-1-like [Drosophila tropicalis]|uniref:proteasome subunit beta type-1-like n=1 Tax=Drosophila tropicalis TaxID=46794 RepID=UPI0035ABD5A0